MPRVCPRPCSRLATAAVFIAVGVVQLLVGIILLRSKYAELLSGPDFMTASSNIGIGCVFGITASIWRSSRKERSKKRTSRNNVLASLLGSIITINITAAAILIMGDGNKLLSLYMDTDNKHSSAAFANEVMAGAYITSVCSPIVCIVVAIVALSGSCFQRNGNKHRNLKNALDIESPFGWGFDPKRHPRPKLVSDLLETPTSSSDKSSSFSEDSVFSARSTQTHVKRQTIGSIPSPLNTWSHKRNHILRYSGKVKKRSQLFDSYLPQTELSQPSIEELIPRVTSSSMLQKHHQGHAESEPLRCDSTKLSKEKCSGRQPKFVSDKRDLGESSDCRRYPEGIGSDEKGSLSAKIKCRKNNPEATNSYERESFVLNSDKSKAYGVDDNSFEYFTVPKSITSDVNYVTKNLEAKIDDLASRHAEDLLMDKINPTLKKLKVETLRELKTRIQSIPKSASANVKQKQSSGILKQPAKETFPVTNKSIRSSIVDKSISPSDDPCSEVLNTKERSSDECTEKCSKKRVAIRKNEQSTKSPLTLVLPPDQTMTHSSDTIHNSEAKSLDSYASKSIGSKKLDFSQRDRKSPDELQLSQKAISSSISPLEGSKTMKNLVLDCPKVPSMKLQSRKRDVVTRMTSMASISEIPSEENIHYSDRNLNSTDEHSGCISSVSKHSESFGMDENSNITPLKDISVDCRNREKPSSNVSLKSLLKAMWSSSDADAKINLSNLIVDEDSLIGLSEEELIARTFRIRALRKGVEERLKNTPEKETESDEEGRSSKSWP